MGIVTTLADALRLRGGSRRSVETGHGLEPGAGQGASGRGFGVGPGSRRRLADRRPAECARGHGSRGRSPGGAGHSRFFP